MTSIQAEGMCYQDKVDSLRQILGADRVAVLQGGFEVDGRLLPVVNEVIVAMDPSRLPERLRGRLPATPG